MGINLYVDGISGRVPPVTYSGHAHTLSSEYKEPLHRPAALPASCLVKNININFLSVVVNEEFLMKFLWDRTSGILIVELKRVDLL